LSSPLAAATSSNAATSARWMSVPPTRTVEMTWVMAWSTPFAESTREIAPTSSVKYP
jgi:hypothetical protein